MTTINKNLSEYDSAKLTDASRFRFGIVVAEWNLQVTESLYNGAFQTLIENGVDAEYITRMNVPGTFELTFGAKLLADRARPDAIIVLGCVIQGETRHFDFICQSITHGITELNLKSNIPFIFGVLTTENLEQALDRAGGKHGNKGIEAAVTAIKMVLLKNN